jgi:hypothetical protein
VLWGWLEANDDVIHHVKVVCLFHVILSDAVVVTLRHLPETEIIFPNGVYIYIPHAKRKSSALTKILRDRLQPTINSYDIYLWRNCSPGLFESQSPDWCHNVVLIHPDEQSSYGLHWRPPERCFPKFWAVWHLRN